MTEALLAEGSRHPQGWPYRMTVSGAYEARHGFVTWEGTHILSIDDRDARGLDGSAVDRQLVLQFGDVVDSSRPGAPEVAHLEAAMDFVDSLPEEAVLVIRCIPGVSRSTALALGLLAREVPPVRAGSLLHALRPFACPNPLLVRLWDDLLGLGGELITVAAAFPTMFWPQDGFFAEGKRRRRVTSVAHRGRS